MRDYLAKEARLVGAPRVKEKASVSVDPWSANQVTGVKLSCLDFTWQRGQGSGKPGLLGPSTQGSIHAAEPSPEYLWG